MATLNNIELSPGVGFFRNGGEIIIFRAHHARIESPQYQAGRIKIEGEILCLELIDKKEGKK